MEQIRLHRSIRGFVLKLAMILSSVVLWDTHNASADTVPVLLRAREVAFYLPSYGLLGDAAKAWAGYRVTFSHAATSLENVQPLALYSGYDVIVGTSALTWDEVFSVTPNPLLADPVVVSVDGYGEVVQLPVVDGLSYYYGQMSFNAFGDNSNQPVLPASPAYRLDKSFNRRAAQFGLAPLTWLDRLGASPLAAFLGGKVNIATGGEEFERSYLSVTGVRDINFTLQYSSIAGRYFSNRAPARGWEYSLECSISFPASDLAIVRFGQFYFVKFEYLSGAWHCLNTETRDAALQTYTNGTAFLSYADGRALSFAADGTLTADADQLGNEVQYTYASGRLYRATDAVTSKFIEFGYDTSGKLETITDNASRQVALTYDTAGDLATITDARGKVTTYGYDSHHQVTDVWDHDSNLITHNVYNTAGQITQQTDARGHAWNIAYTSITNGSQATVTDRNSKVHVYTFDADRNLTSYENPNAEVTSYEVGSHGQVTKITLPSSREIDIDYSTSGDIESIGSPSYLITSTSYLSTGLPSTVTAGGRTLQISRDSAGIQSGLIQPNGITSTLGRNSLGQVNSVTATDGSSLAITYDDDMPETFTTGAGQTVQVGYDGLGRMNAMTLAGTYAYSEDLDENGNVLSIDGPGSTEATFTYDSRSRPATAELPDGRTYVYGFDGNHNLTTVTDALSRVTTYAYDNEDRLTGVTLPGNRTWQIVRDDSGRVDHIESPEGATTSYTYDEDGNVLSVTKPDLSVTSWTYDSDGLPESETNPLENSFTITRTSAGEIDTLTTPESRIFDYDYDSLGQLSKATLPSTKYSLVTTNYATRASVTADRGGRNTTVTHDIDGRIDSITNAIGTTDFTFGTNGLLSTIELPSTKEFGYGYDTRGFLHTVTTGTQTITIDRDNAGRVEQAAIGTTTVHRGYDAIGRRTSYTDTAGNVVGYGYNTAGDMETLTYPDNTTVTYGYNDDGQITTVTDWASRVTSIGRDGLGRPTTIEYPNGVVTTYTYTPDGKVDTITTRSSSDAVLAWRDVGYSNDGRLFTEDGSNLPSALPDTATFTFTGANQLEKVNGTNVTHDADGNLTAGPIGLSPPLSTASFTYDAWNRLSTAGGVSSSYDPEGRRVAYTTSAGTTGLVFDTLPLLDRVLAKVAPDESVTKYVYADFGLLYEDSAAGGFKAYHYDTRGSTIAITDEDEEVIDTFSYGPFGEPIDRTGTTDTPFRFDGQFGVQTDPNGLLCMRARFYHPQLRRFVSQDSFLGNPGDPLSLNRYAFVNGDPVSLVDPTGFFAQDYSDGLAGGALIGDFYEPQNFGQGLGQFVGELGVSLVPAAGQAADVRDLAAAFNSVDSNGLSFSTGAGVVVGGVAFIPVIGDGAKGLLKAGRALFGESSAVAAKSIGYHATHADIAPLILENGFRPGTAPGRLGSGGTYVNSSPEGAIAEFQYHNPGVTPSVLKVEYNPGINASTSVAPNNYVNTLPFYKVDSISAPSLRLPGTTNTNVLNGSLTITQ